MYVLIYLFLLINPIIIKLPNGHYVSGNYSRIVHLNQRIHHTNVLYVLDILFHLISISKLSSSLKCELIFSFNECVLQDFKTRDKIGSVELVVGLYMFNSSTKENASLILNCVSKNINLSHYRMGHPSYERLQSLKTYYPNIYVDKSCVCDVCHQAK